MTMFESDRPEVPEDSRLRLAAATRQVISELASSSAIDPDSAFAKARDLVEQAVAILAASDHPRTHHGGEASLAAHQQSRSFLASSPFIGLLNPLSPPISMEMSETMAIGTVRYGAAYEGPPGCVHGGFIAAGFDEVLGFAQALSGHPGMTGRLDISYRSPTPLLHEVRYEGWIDRVDGRKIFASATLRHGDTVCAEATGLFISMRPEVYERFMRLRAGADG